MHEPITKGKVSEQCLLASTDWEILAHSRLSCASKMSFCNFCMISHAEISSCEEDGCGGIKGGIKRWLCPIQSWKGVKLVEALVVLMMWKQIYGSTQDHPCWFLFDMISQALIHCFICSFAHAISLRMVCS